MVKNMTAWQWVGLGIGSAIVAMIPIIGLFAILIGYIYVAFSNDFKDHVLQNYAKGALIQMVIAFVLIFTLGVGATFNL